MVRPVTDPALLEQLNGGGGAVTDPALLELLNANPQAAKAAQFAGGDNVKEMNPVMKVLGGAKSAFDRAAYGVGSLVPDILPDGVRDYINDSSIAKFTGLTLPSNKQMADDVAQGRAFVKEAGGWGTAGDIAGEVGLTLVPGAKGMQTVQAGGRMLPRALGFIPSSTTGAAAISGGAINALTTPDDRVGGAIAGAAGGAIGDLAGRALVKTLGGINVTQDARKLLDAGIDVPAWKAAESPNLRGLFEAGKGVPFLGNQIRAGERRGFEGFNEYMVGKATPPKPVLDDVGNVLRWESSPVKEIGSDAINALKTRFNDSYDALYKGRGIPVDDIYGNEAASIIQHAKDYFPRIADDIGSAFKQVDDILRKGTESTTSSSAIVNQAGQPFVNTQLGHAATRPESVKQAIDVLDTRIKSAYQRGDAEAGDLLKDLRGSIEQLRLRGLPPEVADQAADINKAYASFIQLQRANSSLGAQTSGVTTPQQMLNAIKAGDRTPNKSGFSGGNALNQEEVLLANRVLGNRLPDVGPGTAEKLMPALMLSGLGSAGGALTGIGPFIGAGLGLALSTKPGQRAILGALPGQAGIRQYGSQYLVPALRNFGMSVGN